jgi:hypothetical protein
MRGYHNCLKLIPIPLVFVICCACSPARAVDTPRIEPEMPDVAGEQPAAPRREKPFAIIKSGTRPFWFELAEGGPRLIASPRHASLEPFIPWKLSRYIAGFLETDHALAAAVNQEGFMIFERGGRGEIIVYYYNSPAWALYSVAALFRYTGAQSNGPAVLLARDTVFTERDMPPPDPALWFLDKEMMRPFTPGFFAGFPAASGWEAEAMLWDGADGGPGGLWYCRLSRRDGANGGPNAVFLKTKGLDGTAERVPGTAFLEAARPRETEAAPGLLERALDEAGALAGNPCTFIAVSPEFASPQVFGTGIQEDMTELVGASAYYREGAALALLPDGRGIVEAAGYSGRFALPTLPENYVYTAVSLAPTSGFTIIAAWEEQKDWNVGAAGFMMLDIRR